MLMGHPLLLRTEYSIALARNPDSPMAAREFSMGKDCSTTCSSSYVFGRYWVYIDLLNRESSHHGSHQRTLEQFEMSKTALQDPTTFYRIVWAHVRQEDRYHVSDPTCHLMVGIADPQRHAFVYIFSGCDSRTLRLILDVLQPLVLESGDT